MQDYRLEIRFFILSVSSWQERITRNNLIPIYVPLQYITCVTSIHDCQLWRRRIGDGYRDQIVTCDVGVSLHSKTHPLFMQYGDCTSAQCYAQLSVSQLVQSLSFPFQNFSFTCFITFICYMKKVTGSSIMFIMRFDVISDSPSNNQPTTGDQISIIKPCCCGFISPPPSEQFLRALSVGLINIRKLYLTDQTATQLCDRPAVFYNLVLITIHELFHHPIAFFLCSILE